MKNSSQPLLYIKFAIESFVIEVEPKMLSVSVGQTNLRTDALIYRNSIAVYKTFQGFEQPF